MAFMGDNTWMTVFPEAFHPNMTHPFDSFNVEDLHTVDEGVIFHLFPLLENASASPDFILAHFLGVDHVGHRLGPDHSTMKLKLSQMNEVLMRVVNLMDEDTLLVVLGDHGMDRTGDHGGDGIYETSAGVWIYSKSKPLSSHSSSFFSSTPSSSKLPETVLETTTYPLAPTPHRNIQQNDLLPTLSLLLGLPIPYNNLGSIIPELFTSSDSLYRAYDLNAVQIRKYLLSYRESTAGSELDSLWDDLQEKWEAVEAAPKKTSQRLEKQHEFMRASLAACRALWAQFNLSSMILGLGLLVISTLATFLFFTGFPEVGSLWDPWLLLHLENAWTGLSLGSVLGAVFREWTPLLEDVPALDAMLFSASFFSSVTVVLSLRRTPKLPDTGSIIAVLPALIHTTAFGSNSFTVWEDRVTLFLLISTILPNVLIGLSAPTSRLRYRIVGFSVLFAVCARLIGWSTICREEQMPNCSVTFFSGSTTPVPPLVALIAILPAAVGVPFIIKRFLHISKSDRTLANLVFPWLLAPPLVLGSLCWLLEWADSSGITSEGWAWAIRALRTTLARTSVVVILAGIGYFWWTYPICLETHNSVTTRRTDKGEAQDQEFIVYGYANAYGAPYLVFWTIPLSLLWLHTLISGQILLTVATVGMLAHLEVVDSVRDTKALQKAFASATPSSALDPNFATQAALSIKFSEIVPLPLLGVLLWFGTGHQATVPMIPWKTAFTLVGTLQYPWSPGSVIINVFGPFFLLGLAAPLLGMWNVSPMKIPNPNAIPPPDSQFKEVASTDKTKKARAFDTSASQRVKRESLRSVLGIILYHSLILIGLLASAGYLRRHLMVWKVWAPRVGYGVGAWGANALGAALGYLIGVERVLGPRGPKRVLSKLGAD
jgi:phosphatidylinositol glycan class O